MISGFHIEVAKNCDLLGYYAASSGKYHYLGYYAASSGKYHYLQHNNPEGCSSHIKIKFKLKLTK